MREVTEKEAPPPPAPGNLHPRYMLGVLESTHTVHKSFSGHQNNVSEKKIFVFSPFIERLWLFAFLKLSLFLLQTTDTSWQLILVLSLFLGNCFGQIITLICVGLVD